MNMSERSGWHLPPWPRPGGAWTHAPPSPLVAEWLEFLMLVERFYARWAAELEQPLTPVSAAERQAAATLAAGTGLRPALALARLVDWWA